MVICVIFEIGNETKQRCEIGGDACFKTTILNLIYKHNNHQQWSNLFLLRVA